ncbi:MAG: hypothetical protein ACXWNK_18520 [Vulcanimicrobiaceae bacterium]
MDANASKARDRAGLEMQEIDENHHGKRCRVYTYDFEEPFVGIVAISRPSGTMIMISDEGGKQRPILRASIKRIELDEPEDV